MNCVFDGLRINSGVEHERVLLAPPPFEYLESREDKAMSFWTGGPIAGSNPVNLMEWVEQQAVRLPVTQGVTTAGQGAAPIAIAQAPTPRALQEPPKMMDPRLSMPNTKSRVYSIATLYSLRKEAVRKNMELKVHPSALKGKTVGLVFSLFASFACWVIPRVFMANQVPTQIEVSNHLFPLISLFQA
jgi:hypothetical protein